MQLSTTAQAWATDLKVADKPTNHIKQPTMQKTIYIVLTRNNEQWIKSKGSSLG